MAHRHRYLYEPDVVHLAPVDDDHFVCDALLAAGGAEVAIERLEIGP